MSDVNRTDEKFYADRDVIKQGQVYVNHVLHMTSEALHSKSDIAAELAHRDIELAALRETCARLEGEVEKRKTFVESQVRINALLNEEITSLEAECERLRVDVETLEYRRQAVWNFAHDHCDNGLLNSKNSSIIKAISSGLIKDVETLLKSKRIALPQLTKEQPHENQPK